MYDLLKTPVSYTFSCLSSIIVYIKQEINSYGGNWMSFNVKEVQKDQIQTLAFPTWQLTTQIFKTYLFVANKLTSVIPSIWKLSQEVLSPVLGVPIIRGGGPRVVVSTAAFHARVRGSVPSHGGLKETKNVSSPSTCESQYCEETPWPRGCVLGLRPPGHEFWIMWGGGGGQCHLNHLTILRRFSWPSLAYICTKVA